MHLDIPCPEMAKTAHAGVEIQTSHAVGCKVKREDGGHEEPEQVALGEESVRL